MEEEIFASLEHQRWFEAKFKFYNNPHGLLFFHNKLNEEFVILMRLEYLIAFQKQAFEFLDSRYKKKFGSENGFDLDNENIYFKAFFSADGNAHSGLIDLNWTKEYLKQILS